MSLILGHYGDVLRAFAVLANAAPSNTDYNIHLNYIKDYTYEGYIAALNDIFAGVSDADMAALMLRNTGLDTIDLEGDGDTDNTALAQAFITANAADRVSAILNLTKVLQGSSLTPAAAFNANFDAAYAYATNSENTTWRAFDGSVEQVLTVGMDKLVGGAMNDFFKAYLVAGGNTFQDGDVLDGGAGEDTLYADIDSSEQTFVITGETKGIENVLFRVQNGQTDSGDNNIAGVGIIDAERMKDVLNWENNNSRADLVIEDIRINDDQITKDITITMRETDPGNVDYGVYFDQNSLRNVSENASQMNLRVLDTYAVAQGLDALKDSPYGAFTFYVSINGGTSAKVKLESQAMQDAKTLPEMVTAMQAAADAYFGAGAVTVSLGSAYTVKDSVTGNDVTGNEIVVSAKSSANIVFSTTEAGSGWLATDTVPAVSGLYTSFTTGGSVTTDLVTSTVVLDYVGRGSMGGDLVIGGLSVGDTSDSKGVQQFDITVEDDSELQTIQSTDNTLQVVNIVNGTQTRVKDAYNTYDPLGGKLVVTGSLAPAGAGSAAALPGTSATHEAYGFTDVRVINAAAMTGKLEFTAQFTEDAVGKYLNLVDKGELPAADNIAVTYTGGSNNDKMTVDLDADATASNSNINVGREDFTFTFNGGNGNDVIDVAIDRGVDSLIGTAEAGGATPPLLGNAEAWYTNQKLNANITINAGEGDDTIKTPGAGDMVINAGAGNDTVYTDNTGNAELDSKSGNLTIQAPRSVWVLNTANQNDVGAGYVLAANDERSLADLKSSGNTLHALYKAEVQVTFRGLVATADIASTNYVTSDLQINQAIKDAINSDPVLNKLLIAQDGPANTLVITSLIDGEDAALLVTDLAIGINKADATAFNSTEISGIASAWTAASSNLQASATLATVTASTLADDAAEINALMAADVGVTTGTEGDDYYAQLAESGVGGTTPDVELDGADSLTTTDNTVTGGTGDDVIVLSTTGDATADAAFGAATSASQLPFSNETVVYDAAFGNDTIVNFKADTDTDAGEFSAGYDILNFRALLGSTATTLGANQATAGAVASTDSLIQTGTFDNTGTALTGVRNDSAAEVAKLYTDDATANKGLYITVDADNIGTVYQIVDGTGTADLTVTLMGTIDLADTAWGSLTIGNFA